MFGQVRNILKEYLSWLARKGRAAEEAVAAAAAAEAPTAEGQEAMTDVEHATASQQPRPPPTTQAILERNRKINNAAAADAVHDFKAVRGDTIFAAKTRKIIQDLFGERALTGAAILQDMGTIGTFARPENHLNEWATFSAITGLTHDVVHQSVAPTNLTIAGMYDYSWSSYPIGQKVNGEYSWGLKGVDLFERIAGDANETGLYFLIDAVNVKFYAALAADQGHAEKKAFFIHSRECLNDGAGKPWEKLHALTKPHRTVAIEIVQDEFAVDILYSPMKSTSTESRSLFNSIYTVRLQTLKKTKEGIHAVCTSFLDSEAPEYSVTITKDSMEDSHPNSVNSLLQSIAPLFSVFQRDMTETNKAPIYKRLQQKRAGDWLQVLSCLDTGRFKEIPTGSMVFFCTEDIIAAAYALATGANVLFTYLKDGAYCIAVFRRTLAPLTVEQIKQQEAEWKRQQEQMEQQHVILEEQQRQQKEALAQAMRTAAENSLPSKVQLCESALAVTIRGIPIVDYYRQYVDVRNAAITRIGGDLTAAIDAYTVESIGEIPRARTLSREFKDRVANPMRAILRKFTDFLAIEYAAALPAVSLESCRHLFETFRTEPTINVIQEVDDNLNQYTTVVDTLLFSAGANTDLNQFIHTIETSTARHASVNTFSPFVESEDGEILSYVTSRGALLPLFQSILEIGSSHFTTLVRRFIHAIEKVYSAIRVAFPDNKDIKRYKAFIYSLKLIAGEDAVDEGRDARDEYELVQEISSVDESTEKDLFFPLHRLIAWDKLNSIRAKELAGMFPMQGGGRKQRGGGGLTSHPITTVWFFYRELLYRIETATSDDAKEPYEALVRFVDTWIQNWNDYSYWSKTVKHFGVLEAFILGIFPVYSSFPDYSSSESDVFLRIPIAATDMEEICSTFAIGFLGISHCNEYKDLIENNRGQVKEYIRRGTVHHAHADFYETYTTILPKVFNRVAMRVFASKNSAAEAANANANKGKTQRMPNHAGTKRWLNTRKVPTNNRGSIRRKVASHTRHGHTVRAVRRTT